LQHQCRHSNNRLKTLFTTAFNKLLACKLVQKKPSISVTEFPKAFSSIQPNRREFFAENIRPSTKTAKWCFFFLFFYAEALPHFFHYRHAFPTKKLKEKLFKNKRIYNSKKRFKKVMFFG